MKMRINPNLIRQKITKLWKFNIFVQKPYEIEYNFLYLYKIIYILEYFLTKKRHVILQTQNIMLRKILQKNNYQLLNFSIFKIIYFFLEKKNKKFTIYCFKNIRTTLFTQLTKIFNFETILFILEKKIKIKKIINWKINNLFFFKTLLKRNKLKNKKYKKCINKKKLKFKKLLIRLLLRMYKPKEKNPKIITYYKIQKKKKKKNIYFFKNQYLQIRINTYDNKNIKKNINFIIKQKILKWKKFTIIPRKIWKNKITWKKKQENNTILFNFNYSQIFNKIFEHKFYYFLKKITNTNNTNNKISIFFQQIQNYPKTFLQLKKFLPDFIQETKFLKTNKKFYNNFINLLPAIEIFLSTENICKQFAIELSRTKKYWRIFKGLETLLIKFFIQWFEKFNIKSQISGIQIIIKGRPTRSSRTKRLIFKYGRYKQTTFSTINVEKIYNVANAKIGTFGITFLMTL